MSIEGPAITPELHRTESCIRRLDEQCHTDLPVARAAGNREALDPVQSEPWYAIEHGGGRDGDAVAVVDGLHKPPHCPVGAGRIARPGSSLHKPSQWSYTVPGNTIPRASARATFAP